MATTIPSRQKLRWEITITLVIKVAVIYLLWWLFFSSPVDEYLTGNHVGDFLFGDGSESSSSSSHPSISPNKEN